MELNATVNQSEFKVKDLPLQVRVDIPNLSPIMVSINNVVCAFSTKCHLNLRKIALEALHVEYRKEAGLVYMKMRSPYTTATIWSSGKLVVTGATSEEKSKIAARKYARTLQRLGFDVRFSHFRVVNVLATCQMPFPLRISHFADAHKPRASYEPELHPGVTYQMQQPKATVKIFSTGSLTVTAPSVENVKKALEILCPQLIKYKTPSSERPNDSNKNQIPAFVPVIAPGSHNTPVASSHKPQLLRSSEFSKNHFAAPGSVHHTKLPDTQASNPYLANNYESVATTSPNCPPQAQPSQMLHQPLLQHASSPQQYFDPFQGSAQTMTRPSTNSTKYPNHHYLMQPRSLTSEPSEIDSSLAYLLQDEDVSGLSSHYEDLHGISPLHHSITFIPSNNTIFYPLPVVCVKERKCL